VGIGVILGLVIGSQAGITGGSWLVVRFRFAEMPAGVRWSQIYASALLLGFSKIGFLAASALCAAGGYFVLRKALMARVASGQR